MQKLEKFQSAFKPTENHKGLKNDSGENNCFLNVTIQALWHLGPFRCHLQQLISIMERERLLNGQEQQEDQNSLLTALCNLFTQYEFTDQKVLPPNELRESLGKLSADYELGKIADASEVLDTILQRIHQEFHDLCPTQMKCLSHATFGGYILEQTICHLCGASSEPTVRTSFLMYFQAAEILEELQTIKAVNTPPKDQPSSFSFFNLSFLIRAHKSKGKVQKKEFENWMKKEIVKSKQFGFILKKCMMAIGKRSCPSNEESEASNSIGVDAGLSTQQNIDSKSTATSAHSEKSQQPCKGVGSVFFFSLDPPLVLALSIGWTDSKESPENLSKFYSLISSTIYLNDLFSDDINTTNRNLPPAWRAVPSFKTKSEFNLDEKQSLSSLQQLCKGPSYVFRGIVCYYGKHYVSIFLDSAMGEEETYLLFDDHRVRPMGSWEQAVSFCVASLYQPVLLLYELEKNSAVFSMDRIQQDYSSMSSIHQSTSSEQNNLTTDNTTLESNTIENKQIDMKNESKAFVSPSLVPSSRSPPKLSEQNYDLKKSRSDDDGTDEPIIQIISIDTVDGDGYKSLENPHSNENNSFRSNPSSPQALSFFPDAKKSYAYDDRYFHNGRSTQDEKEIKSVKFCDKPSQMKDPADFHDNASINSNKNILPQNPEDLESESIKSIRKRYPFLKDKYDPSLDIYTDNGRNKTFWRRYYEARYGVDNQVTRTTFDLANFKKYSSEKDPHSPHSDPNSETGSRISEEFESIDKNNLEYFHAVASSLAQPKVSPLQSSVQSAVVSLPPSLYSQSKESTKEIAEARMKELNQEQQDLLPQTSSSIISSNQSVSELSKNSKLTTKFNKYKIQFVISVWGRRPYRYHVSLPLLRANYRYPDPLNPSQKVITSRVILGIILDMNELSEVFVTDFYKHPVTNEILPAEESGKIQLMDQLIAINGELLDDLDSLSINQSTITTLQEEDSHQENGQNKLILIHKILNSLQEPFILLQFQSSSLSELWFQCPNCSATNEISAEREEKLKKQLVERINKRKIRKHDNSNAHSIDNYGIYFTCKFCQTKSFCESYLPDLSTIY